MYLERRRYFISLVLIGFFFTCKTVVALEIEPGVGAGVEFTNNVKLTQDDEKSDQIATAYAGISLVENKGRLTYDAKASVNKHTYLQDTYSDRKYYRLNLGADWDMIPDRFVWNMSDTFSQRLNNINDPNTPDNVQDTNVFKFGARMTLPLSERQNISLIPLFSQYYYQDSPTNNRQYAITANWNYLLYPTANVGLNLGAREVDYFEQNLVDLKFTNAAVVIDGHSLLTEYFINLGTTTVTRDNSAAQDTSGFTGSLKLITDVSSRSTFTMLLLSDISDTSSVSNGVVGDINDVEVNTDVIRNELVNFAYQRRDEQLHSRLWAEYREIRYDGDLRSDRLVRTFGASMDYPVTQLLSSGVYTHYTRTTDVDTQREDKKFTIGGNAKYKLSSKMHCAVDIKYRTKESTAASQDFDEVTVFANLVYGYGGITKPTRAGSY